jgi:Bacterial SH3 domain
VEALIAKAKPLASARPTNLSAPSTTDIAALAERFDEPLRGEIEASQPAIPKPPAVPRAARAAEPRAEATPEPSQPAIPRPPAVPRAERAPEPRALAAFHPILPKPSAKPILSRSALVAALGVLTLVPVAILVIQLWQDIVRPYGDDAALPRDAFGARETVYAKKDTGRLKAEAHAGDETAPSSAKFGANDVTGSLSSDAAGWGIEPNVASALPFLAPTSASSEAPNTATAPSPTVTETAAKDEKPYVDIGVPPPKPAPPAEAEAPVRTVKVVTIQPPGGKKPHDGAYALGAPADEPAAPAEWMVTKTAVDMHAKAQQSSETVKVAQGGIRVRVTGRHRGWIQVQDPTSSTTGWIYNRFLKPADTPAQ